MGGELLRLGSAPLHEEREWESEGVTVLRAEVTLPQCEGESRAARRFNGWYRRCASAYLRYCAEELYPRAAAGMRGAMVRSAPWERASAVLGYTVTLARGGLLSLYTEGREENLAPPLTIRRAEIWSLHDGLMLEAADFFPRGTPVRRLLAERAREAVAARQALGARYAPDARAQLRRALSLRNFYLTPEGAHWFYPMYALAPAAAGIPDFCLPYGEEGPFLPPAE